MGQVLSLRRDTPINISAASNYELWVRLHDCERLERELEGIIDADQTLTARAGDAYRQVAAVRREIAAIEAALQARFLSFCGGVSMRAFLERLG